jgi:hypothetical protein
MNNSIKCSLCKEFKTIESFNNDKTAPDSRYKKHYWCKECFLKKQKIQKYHIETESRFITRLISTCKTMSVHRGKRHPERGAFDIDRNFINNLKESQNNKCAVSGVELSWKHNSKNKVSIDRIDSSKGYTKDNVRLVTQQVNYAISNFEYSWFLDMCKNVVLYNKLL